METTMTTMVMTTSTGDGFGAKMTCFINIKITIIKMCVESSRVAFYRQM